MAALAEEEPEEEPEEEARELEEPPVALEATLETAEEAALLISDP